MKPLKNHASFDPSIFRLQPFRRGLRKSQYSTSYDKNRTTYSQAGIHMSSPS